MSPRSDARPVIQLRVALTASDYASLVEFYRAGLGIEPAASWTRDEDRGQMFDMGRATLEILDEGYSRYVDEIEAGEQTGGRVRLALQVPDVAAAVDRLLQHGAKLVRPPVDTPWGDLNARVEAPDGLQVTVFEVRSDR